MEISDETCECCGFDLAYASGNGETGGLLVCVNPDCPEYNGDEDDG